MFLLITVSLLTDPKILLLPPKPSTISVNQKTFHFFRESSKGQNKQLLVFLAESLKSDNADWRSNKSEWIRPKSVLCHNAFGDRAKVTGVCWSDNGHFLAVSGDDGTTKLFSFDEASESFRCLQTHSTHREISQNVSSKDSAFFGLFESNSRSPSRRQRSMQFVGLPSPPSQLVMTLETLSFGTPP